MIRKSILALLLAASGVSANANTVTQWNFNSATADAATSTGTITPAIGTGSATLIGGTTSTFASGDASGGSSDPATGDDSGWNITTFAAATAGNKTRGAQFNVSTLGFENITLNYDLRHSNTSSRQEQVQYSLDGLTFNDIASFSGNVGDSWFNGRSVNLSAISGIANNANFAFRVVAAFDPSSSSSYLASSPTGTYGTSGTWRFDMVTVSGTAIAAVPEPKNYAMLLAGLGLMGFIARRRSSR